MKIYTFDSLSSFEFEHLSRDLLQEELGITLESFAAGPDQGMDARWVGTGSEGKERVIVQCKHYARSGFGKLIDVLKAERKKIERLKPTRYILTTSVPLTPPRKDSILGALAPYCNGTGDVYGPEGLNNLLGKHEQIERRHYKLWLTSSTALAKLSAAPTLLDSEAAVARMRERLKRYVQNDSFPRALELLEQYRFCLITGNPGVGKTTLAEALLVRHIDMGYQGVRVTNRLSELKGVTDPGQRQIFYYDDFLGKTGLDKTEHNEDDRLVEFLEQVSDNSNWRFILTTRNYILNAALARSESLAHFPFKPGMCAVLQEDYTRPIKARILYNHTYFSDLPAPFKLELTDASAYKQIIEHPNYNPRVIEHMTDAKRLRGVTAGTYLEEFVATLHNPLRVWEHAFRRHVSQAARHVLLALFILPDNAQLEDLRRVFWALHDLRRREHNLMTYPNDFEAALKELDGNFILTDRLPWIGLGAKFQNPSVRDFLEQHLTEIAADARDLVRIADRTIHFRRLWDGRHGEPFPGVVVHLDEFISLLRDTVEREMQEDRARRGIPHSTFNWEGAKVRLNFALEIRDKAPSDAAVRLVRTALSSFNDALAGRDVAPDEAEDVLEDLRRGRLPQVPESQELVKRAKEFFLSEFEEMSDCIYGGTFIKNFPEAVTPKERKEAADSFRGIVDSLATRVEWMDSSPNTVNDVAADADQIQELAPVFGVDVRRALEKVRRWLDEHEATGEEEVSQSVQQQFPAVEGLPREGELEQYAEIERYFSSYRSELSNVNHDAPADS